MNLLKKTQTYLLGGALGLATVLGGCDVKEQEYESGVITHKETVRVQGLRFVATHKTLMVDIDGDNLFDRVISLSQSSNLVFEYAQIGDSIKFANKYKDTKLYLNANLPGRIASVNGRRLGDIEKINTLNEYRKAAGQQKTR